MTTVVLDYARTGAGDYFERFLPVAEAVASTLAIAPGIEVLTLAPDDDDIVEVEKVGNADLFVVLAAEPSEDFERRLKFAASFNKHICLLMPHELRDTPRWDEVMALSDSLPYPSKPSRSASRSYVANDHDDIAVDMAVSVIISRAQEVEAMIAAAKRPLPVYDSKT